MPLFWFMSSANRIKIIRDKTFCFDVWLGPNPHKWHTSRIHGASCNFEELRGIRMFEVPPLFLGKRTMTGSLSQNLLFHLQANGKWLTILDLLKKKNKKTNKKTNKQTKTKTKKQKTKQKTKQNKIKQNQKKNKKQKTIKKQTNKQTNKGALIE